MDDVISWEYIVYLDRGYWIKERCEVNCVLSFRYVKFEVRYLVELFNKYFDVRV